MAGSLLVFPEELDVVPDISRITGLPWFWARVQQRGPMHPVIDTRTLSETDRLRVALTLACGHYYCDTHPGADDGRGNDSDHLADLVVGGGAG